MISGRSRNFLAMAEAAAGNSKYRHRLGAVVVAGGRVRGVGWSKRRNVPSNVSERHVHHCSVHAEADALRDAGLLRRASCFVARLDAQDRPALAKPCEACWDLLLASGVTKVYWTISEGLVGMARVEEIGGLATAI